MLSAGELASLKAENLRAMPDTAMILRPTITNGPAGARPTFPPTGPTTPCRLGASVLSGGNEQAGPGQLVSIMTYALTVPAGTDVQAKDRVKVGGDTFEVLSVKGAASWNLSDSASLAKID